MMVLTHREIRGIIQVHTFINLTILKTIIDIQLITDKGKVL